MSNSGQRPYSIKIFVADGDPDSLRLVEKSNWTGVGIVFNRTNYKQVFGRPELERTGVYVLVGTSDDSALPTIYVGEGDPVKDRLNSHYGNKDFWEWAVSFVTKDSSLNKAHVQLLECRLVELARAAKQCKLDNGTCPTPPSLSEADTADIESFLADMLSIFPLLGLGVFEKADSTPPLHKLLYLESKGVKATGYEGPKGFVVRQGSRLVLNELPSIHTFMTKLRADLLESGVIVKDGQFYVFAQDHVFNSPSTASGVILGRPSNGRLEWKSSDGRSLKEIQTAATLAE
jgi:hypothetical protein